MFLNSCNTPVINSASRPMGAVTLTTILIARPRAFLLVVVHGKVWDASQDALKARKLFSYDNSIDAHAELAQGTLVRAHTLFHDRENLT